MKAAVVHGYGGPEAFRIEEVPDPTPGPRDLLVEVHAASVNPVDWKILSGAQRTVVRTRFPAILGLDASGVVRAVGSEVTRYRPGDEVYSSPTHRRPGTYAELCCIDEREAAPKPRNLSHVEAASLPLCAQTAWQCVAGRVAGGDRVLITVGSGGVGICAIQLARSLGGRVSATCGAQNAELVTSLGAERAIDYRQERLDQPPGAFDFVLDAVGMAGWPQQIGALRRGGRLATIVTNLHAYAERYGPVLGLVAAIAKLGTFRLGALLRRGIRTAVVVRRPDGAVLEEITRRVEAGQLRPVLDRVLLLEEVALAHRLSREGRARGKIVLAVR